MSNFIDDNSQEYLIMNKHDGLLAKTRNKHVELLKRHSVRCLELTKRRFSFHHDLASNKILNLQQQLKKNLHLRPWQPTRDNSSRAALLTADTTKLSPGERARFLLFRRIVSDFPHEKITMAKLCEAARERTTAYFVNNITNQGQYELPPKGISSAEFLARAKSSVVPQYMELINSKTSSEFEASVKVLHIHQGDLPKAKTYTLPVELKYTYGFNADEKFEASDKETSLKKPSVFITEVHDVDDEKPKRKRRTNRPYTTLFSSRKRTLKPTLSTILEQKNRSQETLAAKPHFKRRIRIPLESTLKWPSSEISDGALESAVCQSDIKSEIVSKDDSVEYDTVSENVSLYPLTTEANTKHVCSRLKRWLSKTPDYSLLSSISNI